MSATRRILEVWEGNRSLEFRSKLSGTTGDVVMVLRVGDRDWSFEGGTVEALHQFTYELLAGPKGDPRLDPLDVGLVCGYDWYSAAAGKHLYCCLLDGHPKVGNALHVSAEGATFDEVPFQ